ncbi:MAG: DUF2281 domain-containing protein [Desulfobacteraceae bacterium]|nr:MAG: DUF2281 domain-containing protein [Desulfobacteraceae bacterium]
METDSIIQEITSLPPEAQKQILDFVAFLKTRYPSTPRTTKFRRSKLTEEPFIGMWRNRKDMQDSATWVRHLRRSEWDRS